MTDKVGRMNLREEWYIDRYAGGLNLSKEIKRREEPIVSGTIGMHGCKAEIKTRTGINEGALGSWPLLSCRERKLTCHQG